MISSLSNGFEPTDPEKCLTNWVKKALERKMLKSLSSFFVQKTSNPEQCYNRQPSDPSQFRYFPFVFSPSHSPQYSSSLPGLEGPVYGPVIRGKEVGKCFQEEYFNSEILGQSRLPVMTAFYYREKACTG